MIAMTKKQFYILNLTWGILLNIVGGIVALVLIIAGHKPQKSGLVWCFEIGEGWGGVNLGLVILVCKDADSHIKREPSARKSKLSLMPME